MGIDQETNLEKETNYNFLPRDQLREGNELQLPSHMYEGFTPLVMGFLVN